MTRMTWVALTAAAMLGSMQSPGGSAPKPATVILVRHAEAAANAGTDPDLTDAGRARVEALVDALRDSRITAVITTTYRRTTQTGEPPAKAANAPLVAAPVERGAAGLDRHVRQVVQMIHDTYAGGTVLVVGHSNTVPALVEALAGVHPGEIAHDSFDRMFIITTDGAGRRRLVRARYGPR